MSTRSSRRSDPAGRAKDELRARRAELELDGASLSEPSRFRRSASSTSLTSSDTATARSSAIRRSATSRGAGDGALSPRAGRCDFSCRTPRRRPSPGASRRAQTSRTRRGRASTHRRMIFVPRQEWPPELGDVRDSPGLGRSSTPLSMCAHHEWRTGAPIPRSKKRPPAAKHAPRCRRRRRDARRRMG